MCYSTFSVQTARLEPGLLEKSYLQEVHNIRIRNVEDMEDDGAQVTEEPEEKSDAIEKECEKVMDSQQSFLEGSPEPGEERDHDKDCFYQCLFKKHDACDEKGNVIEKNVVTFFLSNSPFKDKQKLKKITRECCKKANESVMVIENDSCNPFSNFVYHCVYEDMHMAI
ncbi:hypothetical protein L9F63_025802 [Diploptera punctata]|uniref:Uncharacterized protein n=1 Tax=Diploptera punctata TaxID=6984 RepID=A0AAD8E2S5_DIPPU|nr:hypothetical protein L9F63_025802 [Diploptera punctata]